MDIIFRCLPQLINILPRPIPAATKLPDWLKVMPATAHSGRLNREVPTLKQCPPFIDAMRAGFLILLPTDIMVSDGGVCIWDHNWDRGVINNKQLLEMHENAQVIGTPLFNQHHHVVKFMNFWMIETPPDYSLLVTHPVNRHDLPFCTLTGLVDTDLYHNNFINFPARWQDRNFEGMLPKGTPIAQCIPIKRDEWETRVETLDHADIKQLVDLSQQMDEEPGVYRKQFRH